MTYIYRLLFLLLFTGCGYQLQEYSSRETLPTISIPYVEGDFNGQLTQALIKEIAASGRYKYRTRGGQFTLIVKIIDLHDENIGFRYDRTRKGRLTHEIIPVETRHFLLAEATLFQAGDCKPFLGPTHIQATVDFDHDYYTIRHRANTFSLGQLTDIDSAEDASLPPLYQIMAEKITDFVLYGW